MSTPQKENTQEASRVPLQNTRQAHALESPAASEDWAVQRAEPRGGWRPVKEQVDSTDPFSSFLYSGDEPSSPWQQTGISHSHLGSRQKFLHILFGKGTLS